MIRLIRLQVRRPGDLGPRVPWLCVPTSRSVCLCRFALQRTCVAERPVASLLGSLGRKSPHVKKTASSSAARRSDASTPSFQPTRPAVTDLSHAATATLALPEGSRGAQDLARPEER